MGGRGTIGVVICCHGELARGLRSAAEMIAGKQEQLAIVGVLPGDGRGDVEAALNSAVEATDRGGGVLVLTDIPGGTPCVEAARIRGASLELVAGVNLPAVIEVLIRRGEAVDVHALAAAAAETGRRHVASGRELFEPETGERVGK